MSSSACPSWAAPNWTLDITASWLVTERLLGSIDVAEPIAQSRLRERRLKKYDVARENWIGGTTVRLWSDAAGKNMEIPALQLTDGLL